MTIRLRSRFFLAVSAAVLVTAAVAGCAKKDTAHEAEAGVPADWLQEVLDARSRRDAFMASLESPLTPQQRHSFTGIHYYPPDPAFRFVVPMDTVGAGKMVTGMDTRQNVRHYIVVCRIHLKKDGVPFTLTVLRPTGSDELFLPFQDATTGKETYEVGRYLDLRRHGPDSLVVDFNYATNPYCAYNDHWACPLVPPENHIPIPITAGEKKFHE